MLMHVYIFAWGMVFTMAHELLHRTLFRLVCLELALLLLLPCFWVDAEDDGAVSLTQTSPMPGPLVTSFVLCHWSFIRAPWQLYSHLALSRPTMIVLGMAALAGTSYSQHVDEDSQYAFALGRKLIWE